MKKFLAAMILALMFVGVSCEKEGSTLEFRHCWVCTMTTEYSGAKDETTKTTKIVRDKTQDEIRKLEADNTIMSNTINNGKQVIVRTKMECEYIKP